jgi:NADP-dependent 3-hydroxy acid dehydrogenase YdfG
MTLLQHHIPDQRVLDMNLLGSLYVARVAAIFLQQGQTKEDDKSLILLSSVAGFNPITGIPVYQVCLLPFFTLY